MIPKKDFVPFALPDITEAEIEAVSSSVRSGWLTTGPNSAAFEEEFAAFLGAARGKRSVVILDHSSVCGRR